VAWQAAFLEACDRLGLPACPDANRPGSAGAGPHAMNKLDGRRVSAAEAWLTPAVRRCQNLTLLAATTCQRVRFARGRAVGVEIEQGGAVSAVDGEEVVLCAGATNTPAILLRSGVGPPSELARLGVGCVAAVPAVGARLLDHPGAAFFLLPRLGADTRRKDPLIQTIHRYASAGSAHGPDMQVQPGSRVAMPRFNLPLVSLMCCVGKPSGAGRIQWPSADPSAKPLIESRILEHPADRAKAVEALQLAWELAQTPAMRAIARPLWPRARILRDRQRLDAWIRKSCDSGYHPGGTVPMGADDDPDAACDGRGRVRGVEGLRVADASLMPTIPTANTNLTALMIGERFAEWLG
jgi:choline dehydrogenase